MFKKILIANRGEIAVRVIRACHELGAAAIAIFSEADRHSRHVSSADEAWLLEGQPGKVYLDIPQIVELAKRAGAEAVHPGYGFLAENADFARAIADAGMVFIGPSPDVIHKMGSKVESRRIMEAAGVPVVPGTTDPISDVETLKTLAAKFGYPVAIKASAGGGGRGLRVVQKESELEQALAGAQREGASYFGNAEVYLEKYLEKPRHIEVQIIGDKHGNVVHLRERDCSSQRRHQKLLEETPAPALDDKLRQKAFDAAVLAGKSIGYYSAGTVEGLVAGGDYYFLEMNTRVQVEHPITEMVTGIDIVKEQIRVAYGEKLSFTQADVQPRGHAIECRINAEDPFKNFMPSPGTVHKYDEPSMPWVRVDSACYTGYQVLPFYDSLLAKLVVWGRDREEAIVRTKLALQSFKIEGLSTTIPFHLQLLEDEGYKTGSVYTTYVEKEFKARLKPPVAVPAPAATSADSNGSAKVKIERSAARNFEIEVNQKHFKVSVAELVPEGGLEVARAVVAAKPSGAAVSRSMARTASRPQSAQVTTPNTGVAKSVNGELRSAMHGVVKQILVKEGEAVTEGQKLLILESMKMESEVCSDRNGQVEKVSVKPGETVESDQLLLVVK
ncbi:MAG: acetyl-CoA carboxylase biotin carboxylase subunit [Candidatus Obscuribacterales bacterium]|jgi:acetyl-CoA/propionyl-CoA carboxylase biotin carboxyl carrier protein|nr:acetyl-CoA carboxylase biotin carboxylase subunit [Candidatus Obscuribacterales bacterium]